MFDAKKLTLDWQPWLNECIYVYIYIICFVFAIPPSRCSPGSWTQVIVRKCPQSHVLGFDLSKCDPLPGATFVVGDVTAQESIDKAQVHSTLFTSWSWNWRPFFTFSPFWFAGVPRVQDEVCRNLERHGSKHLGGFISWPSAHGRARILPKLSCLYVL